MAIFGESAGGWSVCQHIVSPRSNGLFSSAIMESGDCDGPWMIFDGKSAKTFGDKYATAVGCPPSSDRVGCLRKLSTSDAMMPYISWLCLLNHTSNPFCNKSLAATPDPTAWPWMLYQPQPSYQGWPTGLPPMAPVIAFAAVIDGTELPEVPIRLISAGKINRSPRGEPISVIMGTNQDEFALFLIAMPLVILGATLPFTEADMHRVTQHLIQFHDNWNSSTADAVLAQYDSRKFKTQSSRVVTSATDFCFRCGTRSAARALSRNGVSTYLYSFEFKDLIYHDPASLGCHLDSEVLCGVFHGTEVPFVFDDFSSLPLLDPISTRKISDALGGYWSAMARTGSPNAAGLVDWPIYNESVDMHLVLSNEIKPASQLAKSNCDFW